MELRKKQEIKEKALEVKRKKKLEKQRISNLSFSDHKVKISYGEPIVKAKSISYGEPIVKAKSISYGELIVKAKHNLSKEPVTAFSS
jgi:hypothetical protein